MAEAIDSLASHQKPFFFSISQIILRILAIVFTATSLAFMLTNSQTVIVFAFPFEAHYYYSSAFKFLVVAEGIVCGFSVLSLLIVLVQLTRAGLQRRVCYFCLLFHDIVMTVLMASGCAAATAIGHVAQYGETHMGWASICENVHKFCRKGLVSLLLAYLAFFAYLGLALLTANKLMSAPTNNSH